MVSIDSALQAAGLWFAAGTFVLLLTGRAAVVGRVARLAMTLAVGAVLAGLALLLGTGVAAESSQPPVQGAGPLFSEPIVGPLRPVATSIPTLPSTKQVPPGQLKTHKH